jgi:hypothetical protein
MVLKPSSGETAPHTSSKYDNSREQETEPDFLQEPFACFGRNVDVHAERLEHVRRPALLDAARFPCLATGTPDAETTIAQVVEY